MRSLKNWNKYEWWEIFLPFGEIFLRKHREMLRSVYGVVQEYKGEGLSSLHEKALLKRHVQALLQTIRIPSELLPVVEQIKEKEIEKWPQALSLWDRFQKEGIKLQELPSDLTKLRSLRRTFAALKKKIILLEDGERVSIWLLEELSAEDSAWRRFYNHRNDYRDQDGSVVSDFWIEHEKNGWKIVAERISHWYVTSFTPVTISDKKF